MVDARQFRRQGIPAATFVRARGVGRFLLLLQFGGDGVEEFGAASRGQLAEFGEGSSGGFGGLLCLRVQGI